MLKRLLYWLALGALVAVTTAGAVTPRAPDDSVARVRDWLVANGAPLDRATAVAPVILRWSAERQLDPLLVVGIIGVENAELHNGSKSPRGATGVMQVMPHWKRDIHECGSNLHNPNVNVCFGTKILRMNLDVTGNNVHRALLRYNGCRAGPCTAYPNAVFSRAGRAVLLARSD